MRQDKTADRQYKTDKTRQDKTKQTDIYSFFIPIMYNDASCIQYEVKSSVDQNKSKYRLKSRTNKPDKIDRQDDTRQTNRQYKTDKRQDR